MLLVVHYILRSGNECITSEKVLQNCGKTIDSLESEVGTATSTRAST